MFNFRRTLCVLLIALLCIGLTGCEIFESMARPGDAFQCKCTSVHSNLRCQRYTYERESYHDELIWDYNIVSVTNHYGQSGSLEGNSTANGFLLYYSHKGNIEGSIEEQETYNFYYVTTDGGYKKMSIPVEQATIYYTEEKPHIECRWQAQNYWFCDDGHENYDWKVTYYKIYVPEGSITEVYSLD